MSIAETLQTQRDQEIGYKAEVVDGEADLEDGVDEVTYQFGEYTTSWGKFPEYQYNLLTAYRGATFDPYEIRLAKSLVQGGISYIPSNAQMLYHALATSGGGASGVAYVDNTGGNFTYTITPVQNLKPKSFTIRYDTNNGTQFHRKDVVGCRVSRLSYNFDFGVSDAVLNSNMQFLGINMDNSIILDNVPPVYADGNPLGQQEEYRYDDRMEARWDTGDDNIDLIPYLLDFNLIVNIINRHRFVKGQLYPKWVGVGNRTYATAFRLVRADETSVFDDFIDQVGNTFKDMRFKIYKNATDYLEFVMSNVAITKCDMNHALLSGQQEPFYDVEAVVKSVIFNSRESTPLALYGTS